MSHYDVAGWNWDDSMSWCGIPLRMDWGWDVPDDLDGGIFRVFGGGFLLDGGEGVEKLVGDVGEDGGTAGGDAILSEEEQKAGEEVVDGSGGFEFIEAAGESGGKIGGFAAT